MFRAFPFTRQVGPMDCGPACLHMLCRYYGKYIDIERIRQLSGVGRAGVSAYDIITTAEQLQFKSQSFSLSFQELCQHMPLPCIAHWNDNHFIIIYKTNGKRIYVADPAIGLLSYSSKEFIEGWVNKSFQGKVESGVCIACEPTISFKDLVSDHRKVNYLEALGYFRSYIAPYTKQIGNIVLVLIVITLLSALVPIITQSVIDSGIPHVDMGFINTMLIASIALGVGIALGTWLQQSITLFFALRVKIGIMSDYISRLFEMPLDFFESRTIGSMMQRNLDFDRIETMMLSSIFSAILAILFFLIFGSVLAIYDGYIFFVFIAGAILHIVTVLGFWSIRKKMDIKYYTYLAQNQTKWVEFLTKITDIKNFEYGTNERRKWEKIQTGLFKTRIKLLHVDQLQNVVTNLIASVRDALLLYIAAKAVISGTMSIGMMAAVLYIIGQLRMPLSNIVNFVVSLQLFYLSYERITDVFKTQTEANILGSNDQLVEHRDAITIKNLNYRYRINEPLVLNNISYSFPSGKITAIIGASGSGKSTLIKILSQLYKPTSGTIHIGNLSLESLAIHTWRKEIGVVTQNSSLISDTISNNIIFGREEDAEKLRKAAYLANIKWEVESMPLAYETVIGENGKGVSEGQKQRILLARAIYNEPAILLLDEITSLLDERNEYNIMKAIRENLSDKTIIIATHRLGSVKMSDNIVVLKSGYIVESGTHDILAARKREYYNLFKSQLSTNEQERVFARS